MKISCTINDGELKGLLAQLHQRLGNLRPVMEEIGQRYERRVLENFERESAPDGTKWPRLSSTTLMMQLSAKRGFGKRGGLTKRGRDYLQNKSLLVLSGRMRSRIHYQAAAQSVRIGVAGIPYAAIHQFGGLAGRGRKVKIPARPYLAMNRGSGMELAPRDRSMVVEILRAHLDQAVR